MRTTKEERADLRARCRAGVIAITTDAALVAALVDDVEELDALVDKAARGMVELATASTAEVDRLTRERDEARADRDAARAAESRLFAETHAEIAALGAEVDCLRAERDARPEITAEGIRVLFAHLYPDEGARAELPHGTWCAEASEAWGALRAHAGKVAR